VLEELEELNGRTIVNIREIKVERDKILVVELDDGSELEFGLGGGIGLDSEWYQFAVVRLNGKEIWRD